MVAIYDAFTSSKYRQVIGVMGAQMGKTEALFNIIGHRFDDGPQMPALYIGPTEKQVRSVSNDRVKKMLISTPSLWAKTAKGHRDKVTEKWIAGTRLGFGWAGSATELASHPAGLVLVDERDRMDSDAGGEGDPVVLARARTKTYPNAKVGVFSTPTIEGGSPIWALFLEGTAGKWAWNCPDCGDWFVPRLELLKWPQDCTPAEAHKAAHLCCDHCGTVIENRQKEKLNAAGQFLYHEDHGGDLVPIGFEAPDNRTASFWVSGLASPWQSFGDIAEIVVAAYRSKEPERIQAAINTYAGEIWKTRGDAPAWAEVYALRKPYAPGSMPEGVQMITAGVDVQKRGLYYVIRGWGFNSESWLLDNGYIAGETEFDNVWLLLARHLEREFPGGLRIQRMFVDSGYRPGDKYRRPDNQVYLFARRHAGRVYAAKGHDTQDRPLKTSKVDMTLSGKTIKGGVTLWHCHTDYLKTWLFSRIRWPEGDPGGWHIHNEIDEDYCRQIVAEEVVTKPSGKRVWILRQKDNHYLDCETLAHAAAMSLQVHTLKPIEPTKPTGKAKRSVSPSGSGFVKTSDGPFIRR